MNKFLFVFAVCSTLFSSNIYAIDVEDNVKNYLKTKDWVSFSIAEETFGRIVATRAATEDERLNTTLTLTFPTNQKCELAPVDLIIKLNQPIENADSSKIFGTVQFDDKEPLIVESILQNDNDSQFIFISMPIKNFDKKIQNSKSLTVNYKGFGVMNFSLSGAKSAIDNATKTCKNFSL